MVELPRVSNRHQLFANADVRLVMLGGLINEDWRLEVEDNEE